MTGGVNVSLRRSGAAPKPYMENSPPAVSAALLRLRLRAKVPCGNVAERWSMLDGGWIPYPPSSKPCNL